MLQDLEERRRLDPSWVKYSAWGSCCFPTGLAWCGRLIVSNGVLLAVHASVAPSPIHLVVISQGLGVGVCSVWHTADGALVTFTSLSLPAQATITVYFLCCLLQPSRAQGLDDRLHMFMHGSFVQLGVM